MPAKCRHCGKPLRLSKVERKEHNKKARERAICSGIKYGRPRIVDYEVVRGLRKSGLTYAEISNRLAVSIACIQRALK